MTISTMKPPINSHLPNPKPASGVRLLPTTALVLSLLAFLSTATFLIFGYGYFSAALESNEDLPTFTMMCVAGAISMISYPLSVVFAVTGRRIFARANGTDQKTMARISVALTLFSTAILSICLLLFILFCGLAIADFRWTPY